MEAQTKRMRITYLHQYFATRKSITSTRSYEIAKYLVSQGHEVTMVTTDAFLEEELKDKKYSQKVSYKTDEGINVIAQRNDYSNHMSFQRRILAFLKYLKFAYDESRKNNADIVFATSTPLTVAIPTLALHFLHRSKYVFEVRDLWPEAPRQIGAIHNPLVLWLMKKLERSIYKHAEQIVSLSPGMSDGIIATGVNPEKVTMVPNFSDMKLFERVDENLVDKMIGQYGVENKFVLAHIGAMGKANGLDYLIQVAEILQKRNDNGVAILIAGDGMTKEKLEESCRAKGLNNVVFTGYIPRENIPEITSLANVTMTCFKNLPILATNSPNKFFDSLAAGKPIIVNSNGWTKDIVEKNQIGYYVDPENPSELADLLQKLKGQVSELKRISPKIKQLAQEQYAVDKQVKKIEGVLLKTM